MSAVPIVDEVELGDGTAVATGWPVSGRQARSIRSAAVLERVAGVLPAADLLALMAVAILLGAPGVFVLAMPAVAVARLLTVGAYRVELRPGGLDALVPRAAAVALGLAVAAAWHVYAGGQAPPDLPLLVALATGGVGATMAVRALALVVRCGMTHVGARAPVIVVGHGRVAELVSHRLEEDPAAGVRSVVAPATEADHVIALAAEHGARQVVLAYSGRGDAHLAGLARRCQSAGLEVLAVPRLFEVVNQRARYETVGALPVLRLAPVAADDWRLAVKHGLDRLAALALLIAAAPLFAACALAVRLGSPGPILFRQRRVGCDGREFELLKFRSMCPGGPTPAARLSLVGRTAPGGVEGEDRRTAVGRFLRRSSLDELPQLLNVLRGEMSLVGPRPERPEFVAAFLHLDRYPERHRVRAGMTGWAQVHGLRGRTSITDRVAYDNHYIEHWSLWLDLKILLLTVLAVFKGAE